MKPAVDIESIVRDMNTHFETLRSGLTGGYTHPIGEQQEQALAWLETFAAISVRVMRHTNPSKLRDAARAEEIKARIEGREVIDG